jgi:hypothetical protein
MPETQDELEDNERRSVDTKFPLEKQYWQYLLRASDSARQFEKPFANLA